MKKMQIQETPRCRHDIVVDFDAPQEGKIRLEDEVPTPEYAPWVLCGLRNLVKCRQLETLIKCISVASGNDACVCMAEYICGNEQEFVNQMNERRKALGMENTPHFVNCNGLMRMDM